MMWGGFFEVGNNCMQPCGHLGTILGLVLTWDADFGITFAQANCWWCSSLQQVVCSVTACNGYQEKAGQFPLCSIGGAAAMANGTEDDEDDEGVSKAAV